MRKTLSKSEISELNDSLFEKYGVQLLNKKDFIQNVDNLYLTVNGEVEFFMNEKQWLPALKLILKNNFLKPITVDMGAIKFVISGADIMRPGIVAFDKGISTGDVVVVIDQQNKKPIAIGKALFSSREIEDFLQGRVVKTLHYVGDAIWKFTP
ncbi:MAG TPA: PUA domain-containing protein [Candidatus Nanoarchaeia archaeon]|nr:PUA domain-containing protein [Candidatus Nanoarchaeia archaeon]